VTGEKENRSSLKKKNMEFLGPEMPYYFWRLNNWIAGPLSESKISDSGFFCCGIMNQL